MKCKGFTLIELLIVVAIIGILAAIAIPNFLQAQTRAKVSRVSADFQSFATAMETYHVDHSQYPVWDQVNNRMVLTTPVEYMSNFWSHYTDPFMVNIDSHWRYVYFCYLDMLMSGWSKPPGGWYGNKPGAYSSTLWGILSTGPDQLWGWGDVVYDPTNGTISLGDISRWGP